MANQAKIGRDWSDDELDLIVADYFSMLRSEQSGTPYVKARHRAELMHGDGAGYDIRSFDPSGAERLLEVKTTFGGSTTRHTQ